MAKKAARKPRPATKRSRATVSTTGRKTASKKRASAPKRRPAARKTAPKKATRSKAPARAAVKGRKTGKVSRPATARRQAKRPARSAKVSRPATSRHPTKRPARSGKQPKAGGTGRESTLAQTPESGRSVSGRTNPMPTKRSTGTAAGAGDSRRVPGLERERKQLREVEESVPQSPSSLNLDRHGSAARSGRASMAQRRKAHTETGPALTGGDVDADWEDAYAVGDEAPGGDNPTPDQGEVDDIGSALGVTYQDNEELKGADKIAGRDKHRWELDPASAEDYPEHDED